MSYIVCDVESDGPIPELFSMVCFGAVIVEPTLSKTFYGEVAPISNEWNSEALAISGISREKHEKFEHPMFVMEAFDSWIKTNSIGQPVFISDNPVYDWQWINYYMHKYLKRNIFGYSARRIGDLYCGMKMNAKEPWKHLRKTNHDHNPVNDAKGNAEALLAMQAMGLKIDLR
jgi:hypothetical protein